MKIRKRGLPNGWFPDSEGEIRGFLSSLEPKRTEKKAVAGVVPHAGWTFCGSMIADVMLSLPDNLETVVILGGHNPSGMPVVRYSEDAWDLPTGRIARDREFVIQVESLLPADIPVVDENMVDNTVEVVLPLVAALHPEVKWAAWRLPADLRAKEFGILLSDAAASTKKRIAVIGSTDLTHYGPNYGFTPSESLENPIGWAKERDLRILTAMSEYRYEMVLELASSEKSACSAGAAVGAMAFAEKSGVGEGVRLGYATSRDVYPSSSFVGYGAIIWEPV